MKLINICCLFTLVLISTSCSSGTKEALGLKKSPPDEFQVISNPSLSVPPDFHLIDPNESLSRDDVYQQPYSSTKEKLKNDDKIFFDQLTDINKSKSTVRQTINQENKVKQEDKGSIRNKISNAFKNNEEPVIDPISEKERIQVNLEEDKPINEGEVMDKSKSTLEKVFG